MTEILQHGDNYERIVSRLELQCSKKTHHPLREAFSNGTSINRAIPIAVAPCFQKKEKFIVRHSPEVYSPLDKSIENRTSKPNSQCQL